jgi:hypothetical protein
LRKVAESDKDLPMFKALLALIMMFSFVASDVGCDHDVSSEGGASTVSCDGDNHPSSSHGDPSQDHHCHHSYSHFTSLRAHDIRIVFFDAADLTHSRYSFLYSSPVVDSDVRPPLSI